jgi:putative endopeptidase
MGEAVGKVYVERHFPPGGQGDGRARREPHRGLPASIESLEWMTPETRERALEKLDAFTPKVGYPVTWKDYSALEVDPPT